jgi:hypothetical protein
MPLFTRHRVIAPTTFLITAPVQRMRANVSFSTGSKRRRARARANAPHHACLCVLRAISVSLNRRLIILAALITRELHRSFHYRSLSFRSDQTTITINRFSRKRENENPRAEFLTSHRPFPSYRACWLLQVCTFLSDKLVMHVYMFLVIFGAADHKFPDPEIESAVRRRDLYVYSNIENILIDACVIQIVCGILDRFWLLIGKLIIACDIAAKESKYHAYIYIYIYIYI